MAADHWHLDSESPDRGEPTWLMLKKTEDGKFYLEDEFDEWPEEPDVNPGDVWPPRTKCFDTKREALERAATIICGRFCTNRDVWVASIEQWLADAERDARDFE